MEAIEDQNEAVEAERSNEAAVHGIFDEENDDVEGNDVYLTRRLCLTRFSSTALLFDAPLFPRRPAFLAHAFLPTNRPRFLRFVRRQFHKISEEELHLQETLVMIEANKHSIIAARLKAHLATIFIIEWKDVLIE